MPIAKVSNISPTNTISQQLQREYGYSPSEADNLSYKFGNSNMNSWDDWAKANNVKAYSNEPLAVDSAFNTNAYGSAYLDGDVIKTSQFGTDKPMTIEQFNTFAENNPTAAQQAGAAGVTFDANNKQTVPDSSWGYKEWGTAGNLGLGAGQLGLGIASYFENKQTAEAQRKLLGQQYDNNADLIAARKAKRSNITSAFGGN